MSRSLLIAATLAGMLAGCTPVGFPSSGGLGHASLRVQPRVLNGQYRTQATVTPYTQADIHHLVLQVAVADGPQAGEVIASRDLPKSQLGSSFTFTHLEPDTRYRIEAFAYRAEGTAPQDLISETGAASSLEVTVGDDDRQALANLPVKLIDLPFDATATSSGVELRDGGYVFPGPEGLAFERLFSWETATWFNPTQQATYSIQGSHVVISADIDHDYWPGVNYNAPRLLFPMRGDFVETVRLQATPTIGFSGAGLLLVDDGGHWVRFEHFSGGIALWHGDQADGILASEIHAFGPDGYLRFEKSGNRLIASCRTVDSQEWVTVATVPLDAFSPALMTGVSLARAANPGLFSADYSEFTVVPSPPVP